MIGSRLVATFFATAAFVLYGSASAVSAPREPLKIVFIGDDTLLTVALEGSGIPCGPLPYPAPCQYQDASPLAFTGVLGTMVARPVDLLSGLGAAQGSDPSSRSISVVLYAQVPQIPQDADVVIASVGRTEVSAGNGPESLVQLQKLAAEIRARAPHARLVLLGLRDTVTENAPAIDAWDKGAQSVAKANGATFIDMRTLFPALDYPDFPDTVHPSVVGSKRLADAVASTLSASQKPAGPAPSAISAVGSPASGTPAPASGNLPPLPSRATRLKIAVLGASMERNVVLDGSPVPCGIIMRAAPCKYEDHSPLSYPTFLGALVNATIYNLSVAGSQAADAKTSGTIPSALESQVPIIPTDTDIVILEIGLNDTSVSGTTEGVLNRIAEVVSGVRARVPNARIIFVGLRDYGASVRPRIDAWNARELLVAQSIGAPVVDLRKPLPATDYTDFPDGTHASVIGGLKIAQLIEAVIDKMRAPAKP